MDAVSHRLSACHYLPDYVGAEMTSLPYMQLYVSDYLADTAHLSAQQHGAYMLLLMNYWQRGKPLDNTGDRLAFVARMSAEDWAENKSVLAEFFQIDGDSWTHARIERDLDSVREKSAKASKAGKQASVQRTLNERSTDAERSFNYKEEDKEEDNKKTVGDFDNFWSAYPLKVGKGAAHKAWLKAISKAEPAAIIEGAKRYAGDPNRDPAYTAHAATWLNAERWTDSELPPRSPVSGFKPITTPTWTPPRFTASEVAQGVPMPANARQILDEIRRGT